MAKQSKTYRLDDSCLDSIQLIADQEFEGNATAAIESLCSQAALMRSIDDRIRHMMYHTAKNEIDHTQARSIVDALHI